MGNETSSFGPNHDPSPYVGVIHKKTKIKATDSLTLQNQDYKVEFGSTPSTVYLGYCICEADDRENTDAGIHTGIILSGNDYTYTFTKKIF